MLTMYKYVIYKGEFLNLTLVALIGILPLSFIFILSFKKSHTLSCDSCPTTFNSKEKTLKNCTLMPSSEKNYGSAHERLISDFKLFNLIKYI